MEAIQRSLRCGRLESLVAEKRRDALRSILMEDS
jgi:hypothetical protein